ncbi:MAG: transcriptional repressor NrdR [Dethiobacter sp.]|jgi:transcriptional repressor NrdR|nr:MAG: transcriptional repressor NrdR [Dethiobacter sp.]
MRCPYCGEYESKVVDARSFDEGDSIRRRRECLQCNKHFTTFEKVEEIPLFVLKRDGRKQLFDRNKILEGLVRAGEKCQISMQTFQSIVDEAERELRCGDVQEISSDYIGAKILEKLLPVDEVAYVRYVSVFYRYRDIEEFKKELDKVISLRQKKN